MEQVLNGRPFECHCLIKYNYFIGSMHDDLQQLRSGAQEIINDLSSRDDNPIYNYVLVVFRDPSKCYHTIKVKFDST